MAVNFGILSQAPTIGARFMEGQQAAAAEQERNMLRQMQAEQMAVQRQRQQFDFEQAQEERRRRVEREGQYQKLADLVREHGLDPDDPKVLGQFSQAALMSGQPQLAQFVTSMAERAARRREAAAEAARIGAILGPQQPGAAAPAVNALTAPAAAAAPAVNALAAPPAAPAGDAQKIAELERQRDALEALGTPAALNQAKRLDRQLEKLRPKPSQLLSPEEEAQRIRIARESRPPAQPREPKEPPAPIAVVDPVTQQVKYVSRAEAVGKTPPSAIEGLTPKERQVREAKYPQATSALKAFETTADTLIKDLEALATHPGLGSITGIVAGRAPGITPQGREAEALYNKIMARGAFQELATMRQSSPTGGALGSVSNKENDMLQAAFAALDRRQDAPSVRKAVTAAVEQIRASKGNLREAYDLTYEYKRPGGAAAPAAPAGGNFPAPPPAAIDALKKGQGTDAQFDAIFGPGAAARARGR